MRLRSLATAIPFVWVLCAATAYLQDVPRNPYTPPTTAYYDVETWPKPFATPGYVRGSNSGIFVESADRIYLLTRGEIGRAHV